MGGGPGAGKPPRRLAPSGWLRRIAYRIPQDKAGHWLLLIAGDRFDVLEARVAPLAIAAAAIGGFAFAWGVVRGPARPVFPAALRKRVRAPG